MDESRIPRGSSVSDKQLGRAAAEGRALSFHGHQGAIVRNAYLIGMDDYHWVVARMTDLVGNEQSVMLIHKSCPMVVIESPAASIDTQHENQQTWYAEVGGAFRSFCRRTYLGKNESEEQS